MYARMVLHVDLHKNGLRTARFAVKLSAASASGSRGQPPPLCSSACLSVCLLVGHLTISSGKRSQNRQTLSLFWSLTRQALQYMCAVQR